MLPLSPLSCRNIYTRKCQRGYGIPGYVCTYASSIHGILHPPFCWENLHSVIDISLAIFKGGVDFVSANKRHVHGTLTSTQSSSVCILLLSFEKANAEHYSLNHDKITELVNSLVAQW